MKKLEEILFKKKFSLNFETLAFINKYFMKEDSIIREDSIKNIVFAEKIIKRMENINYNNMSREELIDCMSKFMSDLWLYQIFYDGNTRTVVSFTNYLSKVYDIPFYYDYAGGEGISVALALTFFGDPEDFEWLNDKVSCSLYKDYVKKI